MENTEKSNQAQDLNRPVTVKELEQSNVRLLEAVKELLKQNTPLPPLAKKWLKSSEVRKILDVSPGKLLTLRINGTLPYTRIGGVIYYDQDDIDRMFSSRKFQHR